jgi:hypothetical protein
MDIEIATERRDVFKALAALGALAGLSGLTTSVARADESTEAVEPPSRRRRKAPSGSRTRPVYHWVHMRLDRGIRPNNKGEGQ